MYIDIIDLRKFTTFAEGAIKVGHAGEVASEYFQKFLMLITYTGPVAVLVPEFPYVRAR